MSKAIKLTLPESLASELESYTRTLGYANIQEITLEALRTKARQLQAIQRLYDNKATKDIELLTPEDRKHITITPKEDLEILRKFNLD